LKKLIYYRFFKFDILVSEEFFKVLESALYFYLKIKIISQNKTNVASILLGIFCVEKSDVRGLRVEVSSPLQAPQ